MPRDGNGNYSRVTSNSAGAVAWQDQVAIDDYIYASEHDIHDQDLADGISASLAKDGQTIPTANLPMGGYIHTGVGDASARTHYAKVSQTQDSKYIFCGITSGTTTAYTASLSPAITAYVDGMIFGVKFHATCGASPTLNLNGLGAKNLKAANGSNIASGALPINTNHYWIYNSTSDAFEPFFGQHDLQVNSISSPVALGSNLSVAGVTTLTNTLSVSAGTTLSSTLAVSGATTLSSTLAVTGATTLSSTLAVTGNITASGNITVASSKSVSTYTVSSPGALALSGTTASLTSSTGAVVINSKTQLELELNSTQRLKFYNDSGTYRLEPAAANAVVIGATSKELQGIHTYGITGSAAATFKVLCPTGHGMYILTNGDATNPKVVVYPTGGMDINANSSSTAVLSFAPTGIIDFKGTMGTSSKNPANTPEDAWVEIKINGTAYYIPAYLA